MKKITCFAISDFGDGKVQKIGTYDSIEDITINIGMFADDVVIEFEFETEEDGSFNNG
jgi:hypothetical protein